MPNWLIKSEPSVYSIDDFKKDSLTAWDGVRNYQARNYLKAMKKGENILFYHSSEEPMGIAGLGKVAKEAYPEALQFDKKSEYFEPAATSKNPRWFCPDIQFTVKFKELITLKELKSHKELSGLVLLQKGSRLSVQPVSDKHFKYILSLTTLDRE